MKEVALNLASAGYRVFPLHEILSSGQCSCGPDCGEKNRAKHPRIKGWDSAASSDPFAISDWWDKWPTANVGVLCGDGLWVLDVDPAKGGNASLEALGPLPETFTVTTPTGGRHLYFNAPVELHNTVDGLGPGLDSRGWHGYVVGPGSRRAGGEYRVTTMGSRADMPQKLTDMAKPVPKPVPVPAPKAAGQDGAARRFSAYLTTMEPSVQGENGSARLMTAACTGVRFGLTQQQLKARLSNGFNERCEPPWSEQELDHAIESAFKKVSDPGSKLASESHRREAEPIASESQEIIMPGHANAVSACATLLEHPGIRGRMLWPGDLAYNEMTMLVEVGGRPMDTAAIGEFIISAERSVFKDNKRKITPITADKVEMALLTVGNRNRYNPVASYFNKCQSRVGAMDEICDAMHLVSPIERLIIRKFMISAVARALHPGCKVDTVLILTGNQAMMKSTWVKTMAVDWYVDTAVDIKNKDTYMTLRYALIYEWAELSNIFNASMNTIKGFVASEADTFRAPYGRRQEKHGRNSVIVGTTNTDNFLDDATGSRRFWPIKITEPIDIEATLACRDAAYGEARDAYLAGEKHYMNGVEAGSLASHSEQFRYEDDWKTIIRSWLPERDKVTIAAIMSGALKLEAREMNRTTQMRISDVLKSLGWVKMGQQMRDGSRESWWCSRSSNWCSTEIPE